MKKIVIFFIATICSLFMGTTTAFASEEFYDAAGLVQLAIDNNGGYFISNIDVDPDLSISEVVSTLKNVSESDVLIYECSDLKSDEERQWLSSVFSDGENISLNEETGKIAMTLMYQGQNYKFIFDGYNQNPIGEEPTIVACGIQTPDDEYSIIVEDGQICLESARRSGWLDHPNATRVD